MQARIHLAIVALLVLLAAALLHGRKTSEGASGSSEASRRSKAEPRPSLADPEGRPRLVKRDPLATPWIRADPIVLKGPDEARPIPAPIAVVFEPERPPLLPGQYAVAWEHPVRGYGRVARVTVMARPPEHLLSEMKEIRFWHHWLAGSGPFHTNMQPRGDGTWEGAGRVHDTRDRTGIRPLIEIVLKDGSSCDVRGEHRTKAEDHVDGFLFHYDWSFWRRS